MQWNQMPKDTLNGLFPCIYNFKDIPSNDESKIGNDPSQASAAAVAEDKRGTNAPEAGATTTSKSPAARKAPESSLDPNHTHFVLVDNPHETGYGGEIEFRARLEHVISQSAALKQSTDGGPGELFCRAWKLFNR
jgi:hypothetical protein